MKIIIPLILLVVTFMTAYYFEEYRPQLEEQKVVNKTQLLKIKSAEEISKIVFPSFYLERGKNNLYYVDKSDFLADEDRINLIFDFLGRMKVKRVFTESESSSLNLKKIFGKSSEIKFKVKNKVITYRFGILAPHDDTFYVKTIADGKHLITLVSLKLTGDTIFFKGEKPAHIEYNNFIRYLNSSGDFFLNHAIVASSSIVNVKINNSWNRSFSVNLEQEITIPKSIGKVGYNKNQIKNLKTQLLQLKAKRVSLAGDRPHTKPVASIEISDISNKIQKLQLFKTEIPDEYLIINNQYDAIYTIDKESVSAFFSNVQDYWDKRVLRKKDTLFGNGQDKFDLTFIGNMNKEHKLYLSTHKKFIVEFIDQNQNQNWSINQKQFKKLFDFLFGQRLGSADRVEENGPEKFGGNAIIVKSDLLDLKLLKIKDELVITNQKNKATYYFDLKDDALSLNHSDYFQEKNR